MLQEEYVSFETAKLLKEKGFNEECQGFFEVPKAAFSFSDKQKTRKVLNVLPKDWNSYLKECVTYEHISIPTHQMAMRWLREKCYCHIVIDYAFKADVNLSEEYVSYCYSAENAKTYIQYTHNEWYSTYEEACEAAIKYCLENLI